MYKNYRGNWVGDLNNGKYKNPILFSDYSDPDVIRVGEDFYMVASSFTYFPGLPILHSTDLVNWELINYAAKEMPLSKYDTPQHGCGIWAPSIRFHDNRFYIYFGDPDEGVFMTSTENIYGEWDKLICVKKAKGWIDTCPFWDDDGSAYLIRGVAKSRIGFKSKLFLHKMSYDGKTLLDDGILVFDGRINHPTIEGPKMYKRNGYYYILAPAGGVQRGWQMMARSRNIYGPYEHKVLLHQGNSPVNGPHQGGYVDLDNGESWFIHFQDLDAYGRVTHLQPAEWKDDWLTLGKDVNNDNIGEPVMEYTKPTGLKSDIKIPLTNDDFNGTKLGLQWQWQAHCKDNFYELTGNSIKLNCLPYFGKNISCAANVMCQLIKQPNFDVFVKVKLKLYDGDSCGLIITGGSYYGIKISKEKDTLYAQQISFELEKNKSTQEMVCGKSIIDAECVYLKISMSYPNRILAFISVDNVTYQSIGNELYYKVSRKSWVGGRIGLFAVNDNGVNNNGYAEVEYLYVE